MTSEVEQETIADIVAEKRARANEIECALGLNTNQFQRELIQDIRAEADRIEAAWKREHHFADVSKMGGNAAAMIEADASRSDKTPQAKSGFVVQGQEVFGRYCKIEMMRYGVPNEFFIHKCITILNSNFYTDVPVVHGEGDKWHREGVDVVSVITCGVDESKVFRVPLKDVQFVSLPSNCYGQSDRLTSYGNAAAMREALEKIDRIVWDKHRHTKEETEAHRLATEAFFAPPRNCDRYETLSEAWRGFLDMCNSRHIDHDPNTSKCLDCPYRKSDNAAKYECFNHWLFAEAEGAANEQG